MPVDPSPVDPATLAIVHYPDPVLRRRALPVPEVTPEVRAVAERMVRMMYDAEGIGLAAPQVGLSWRLFVVDVPENDEDGKVRSATSEPATATSGPVVYINPVLRDPQGAVEPFEEGCLSLPDVRGSVLRPPVVTIEALGVDGKSFTQTGAGLLARCWQHELDHLDGVLIIDRMTQMSRLKARRAIKDLEDSRA
jgi:peptide deformylase